MIPFYLRTTIILSLFIANACLSMQTSRKNFSQLSNAKRLDLLCAQAIVKNFCHEEIGNKMNSTLNNPTKDILKKYLQTPDRYLNLPMHHAVAGGDSELINKLMEKFPKDVGLEKKNSQGFTPHMLACALRYLNIAKGTKTSSSTNSKFDYNIKNKTHFSFFNPPSSESMNFLKAAAKGDVDTVKELIPSITNSIYQEGLNYAAVFNHHDVVVTLIEKNKRNLKPLVTIKSVLPGDSIRLADCLMKFGITPKQLLKHGLTTPSSHHFIMAALKKIKSLKNSPNILSKAIKNGCPLFIVKEILAKGPKINDYNRPGETPLHVAAYHNNADIVNFLIQKRADPAKLSSKDFLPIHYANSPETCSLIIKSAPQTINDQSNPAKLTPLHLAVLKNKENLCICLLENGATPTLKSANNETPLDIAKKENNQEIEALLFKYLNKK